MSADFLAEAKRRAQAAGLDIAFTQARAEALPYPDHSFEMLWAERVLIYVPEVRRAASEMRRVLRPGGRAALIEPDISTSTINLEDRALVRRVMGHEADSNVAHGWLRICFARCWRRWASARSSLRPGWLCSRRSWRRVILRNADALPRRPEFFPMRNCRRGTRGFRSLLCVRVCSPRLDTFYLLRARSCRCAESRR